jgi:hypothetical protein
MLTVIRPRARLLVTAAAALALTSGVAWAQNAHFVGQSTATLNNDSSVDVCFKEAGLGSNQNITYNTTALATATYVCVNRGGECPNAANKTTVSGPVTDTGTFSSGKNGNINECLTLEPPGPGSFRCPGGQTRTLSEVTYTNITLTDITNSVTSSVTPSTISDAPFTCPSP